MNYNAPSNLSEINFDMRRYDRQKSYKTLMLRVIDDDHLYGTFRICMNSGDMRRHNITGADAKRAIVMACDTWDTN